MRLEGVFALKNLILHQGYDLVLFSSPRCLSRPIPHHCSLARLSSRMNAVVANPLAAKRAAASPLLTDAHHAF